MITTIMFTMIFQLLQSDEYGCVLTAGLCEDTAQRFGEQVISSFGAFGAFHVSYFSECDHSRLIKNRGCHFCWLHKVTQVTIPVIIVLIRMSLVMSSLLSSSISLIMSSLNWFPQPERWIWHWDLAKCRYNGFDCHWIPQYKHARQGQYIHCHYHHHWKHQNHHHNQPHHEKILKTL